MSDAVNTFHKKKKKKAVRGWKNMFDVRSIAESRYLENNIHLNYHIVVVLVFKVVSEGVSFSV